MVSILICDANLPLALPWHALEPHPKGPQRWSAFECSPVPAALSCATGQPHARNGGHKPNIPARPFQDSSLILLLTVRVGPTGRGSPSAALVVTTRAADTPGRPEFTSRATVSHGGGPGPVSAVAATAAPTAGGTLARGGPRGGGKKVA